eukprot:CAMPEP_0202916570 /NCGR_PEP_ID=MMETSP1392-20130828/68902_1 /ASSEMBLY_ACC=CAM_ASM_000868 /TAXON_ID=225041 /ORGANISM="Chlamydomonas chlamydogama, Strain SAG 11-48b" /LENGTH=77 /DNA_ID=CAMNT_0049609059 /DNA_START=631 /DNA_END=864 /DNA_ORIENTATION=+
MHYADRRSLHQGICSHVIVQHHQGNQPVAQLRDQCRYQHALVTHRGSNSTLPEEHLCHVGDQPLGAQVHQPARAHGV